MWWSCGQESVCDAPTFLEDREEVHQLRVMREGRYWKLGGGWEGMR